MKNEDIYSVYGKMKKWNRTSPNYYTQYNTKIDKVNKEQVVEKNKYTEIEEGGEDWRPSRWWCLVLWSWYYYGSNEKNTSNKTNVLFFILEFKEWIFFFFIGNELIYFD
jgi:hypothetical protein